MFSAFVSEANPEDPISALQFGDQPEPEVPAGWARVQVKAAALNHHDLWSLKGVGLPAERMPMILGTDAAGIDDDGNEVLVHGVIASAGHYGDESFDAKRTLLSEIHQGAMAEYVVVPQQNLVAKPAEISFEEAACLPTAWLTAYRMLTRDSGLKPGDTVLIQGASGGVSTACIAIGRQMGLRVWVTGRSQDKCDAAIELGAHEAFESGARLPGKADAVIDSVGEATWAHSMRSLRPGGTIVTCGATSGPNPKADLNRMFFFQLNIVGSMMGNRTELEQVVALCRNTGIRPPIAQVLPLADATPAFAAMNAGETAGKFVFTL
ncbi:MAG: zinc-binding dehydrogenase [Antricoccus sp.]